MSGGLSVNSVTEIATPRPIDLLRYMRDVKGITFSLVSEEDAVTFLEKRNYYFKLKAFAKNYEKYQRPPRQEMYVNLDFGHLVELSRLDKELRSLVLALTLDRIGYAMTGDWLSSVFKHVDIVNGQGAGALRVRRPSERYLDS